MHLPMQSHNAPLAIEFSIVYNQNNMVLATETRGRPRYVADYITNRDLALPLYYEFYEACDMLSYRQMLALSRLLGVSLRTVYRWKAHEDFPRHLNMALTVIDWTKLGKPIKLETQAEIADKGIML